MAITSVLFVAHTSNLTHNVAYEKGKKFLISSVKGDGHVEAKGQNNIFVHNFCLFVVQTSSLSHSVAYGKSNVAWPWPWSLALTLISSLKVKRLNKIEGKLQLYSLFLIHYFFEYEVHYLFLITYSLLIHIFITYSTFPLLIQVSVTYSTLSFLFQCFITYSRVSYLCNFPITYSTFLLI